MDDISAVRLKSSDQSTLTKEEAEGDGTTKFWKLGHRSILASPALEVRLNGVLQSSGYTVDTTNGIVTFTTAPLVNVDIEFTFYWSQFTDEQIQYFLDDNGGDTSVAAAKVLLAIAADASKVAERQSLAGGGGLGAVTIDTSVTARELRNTALAIIQAKKEIATADGAVPAEGLTEPIWTEMNYRQMLDQRIVRG